MSRTSLEFLIGHCLIRFLEREENIGGDDLSVDTEFILDMLSLRHLLSN